MRIQCLFVSLFFISFLNVCANIQMRGNTSFIRVLSGANFIVNQAIGNFTGKLVKEAGASISGENITFTDGLLFDQDNRLLLDAIFDPSGSIKISGNKTLHGNSGQILQSVQISGINNKILGQQTFFSDITLQDSSTTVTIAVQSPVNQNIILNGGTVILEGDLKFNDLKSFTGDGIVNLNGYQLSFGGLEFTIADSITLKNASDMELNSKLNVTGSLEFDDEEDSCIQGNGHALELQPGGSIVIGDDTTLFMTDVVLKGLGASGGTIVFSNDNSQLCLSNVFIELIGTYTMTKGGIFVEGPTTFLLKNFNFVFDQTASLTVDGVTLWKDQVGIVDANRGDVTFANQSSMTMVSSGTIKYAYDGDDEDCCSQVESLETRVDTLETCCDALSTSTTILQSQIDAINLSCCDALSTSTTILQSQIDALETSTGELQSQIDTMDATCCDALSTSTTILQSQIDELITSTGELQSEIDTMDATCCDALSTSTTILQSQIDELITSTGELQTEIDECCDDFSCVITVTGDVNFTLDMLPTANQAKVFRFNQCYAPCSNKARVIFDPAIFGNGGSIELPVGSRTVFSGDGIVELKDGVIFNFQGTSFCPNTANQTDWPALIIEDKATMHLGTKATVTIGGKSAGSPGAGKFMVRCAGQVLLDQESHLIFGLTKNDDFLVQAEFVSGIKLKNKYALITFQKGCFDIEFNKESFLHIGQGAVELNMYRGALTDIAGESATGIIKKLYFDSGSELQVMRNNSKVGSLCLAPNINLKPGSLAKDITVDFSTKCGSVCGLGFLQFKEFVEIATTISKPRAFSQVTLLASGSQIGNTSIVVPKFTIFKPLELPADILIPAGSIFAVGSEVNGSTLTSPLVIAFSTIVDRGTILGANSQIARQALTGGSVLTSSVLLAPLTVLPGGTVMAVGSEIVNSTVVLQDNLFELNSGMVEIFMRLGYILNMSPKNPLIRISEENDILIKMGTLNTANDGRLSAFVPPLRDGKNRDGSIVGLQEGDHDITYNRSVSSTVLDEIRGYNFASRVFVIKDGNELQRR